MTNTTYQKFVARWEEVMDLPPQRLGPFTPIYKRFVKHLKVMPWPFLVLGAGFLVFGLYFFIGSTITFLVSLLQRGF
jgi:hypothetical protein